MSKNNGTDFTFRGKEIVLSKTRGRPFSGLVKKGMEKGMYPEQKRIEAATLYAATGNMARVSELSGVPLHLVRTWRRTDWFQDLLREIWEENNEKIDAKFTQIIEKSLEQIQDRLENGDVHVLKTGEIIRKPISAKDLSLVSAINVDKRQLLRGLPTARTEAAGATDKNINRLERIAETFENLARFGRGKVEVIDVQVTKDEERLSLPDGRGPDGALEAPQEGHPEEQVQEGKA